MQGSKREAAFQQVNEFLPNDKFVNIKISLNNHRVASIRIL
jgi:hypothetical protein